MKLAVILNCLFAFTSAQIASSRYAATSVLCGPLNHVWGAAPLHIRYGAAPRFGDAAFGCQPFEECVVFTCFPGQIIHGPRVVKCDVVNRTWTPDPPHCTRFETRPTTTTTTTTVVPLTAPPPLYDLCFDGDIAKDDHFCWRPKIRWRYNDETMVCERVTTCSRGPDLGGDSPNVFATQLGCRIQCHGKKLELTTSTTTEEPTTTRTTTPTSSTTAESTTVPTTISKDNEKEGKTEKVTKDPEVRRTIPRRKTGGLRGPQCLKGVDLDLHSSCNPDSPNLIETVPLDGPEILELHNRIRKNVSPPARFMPELAWNFDLAITAERFAASCPSEISDVPEARELVRWKEVGQNTCHSISSAITIEDCIEKMWLAEKENWHYGIGEINPDAVVSHYTQMIWSGTLFVGCGIARCANSTWTTSIVCNYAPAGNIAPAGQNPTAQPYILKEVDGFKI